jgi:tRNA uridine 5-carbamoylmethylation protein Kti12
VHVGTPADKCREINTRLLADKENDGGYEEEDFENLIFRYEEPNGMTRWDSPLFTVLDEDETPPFDQIWEAMVGSDGKMKVVRPNQATVLVCITEAPRHSSTDGRVETCHRAELPLRARQNHIRYRRPDYNVPEGP